jgi:hypothetical protein
VADNLTTQSNGALPGAQALRTRDVGSSVQAAKSDVAPWVPTKVTGGQYALSVTTTPSALTVPSGATHALISVDTGAGNIRWKNDGGTASTTAGHLLQAGDAMEADNRSSVSLASTTGTVVIQVSYHKYI